MQTKFLLFLCASLGCPAFSQTLDHQAVLQNIPVPDGWVPAPKLVLDNTKNLPVVFVEQGNLTTLTFPKEVEWCAQKSNLFGQRVKGRKASSDEQTTEGEPFTEIDVFTRPDGVQRVSAELSAYGRDIYSAEPGNMNCRFTSGEIAIIMLKIAPRPYMSVEFVIPNARRDYSAFTGIRGKAPASAPSDIHKVPFDPDGEPYFVMPEAPESQIASDTKRDWSVFRAAGGASK